MDPLNNPLRTRPIPMGREMSMEMYPNRQFGFIYNLDRQSGSGSDLTCSLTRSDGPDPLLTIDTTCLIGFRRPRIGVITLQIGTRTCCIRDVKLTCLQNSLKSQFLMMISPTSSHLSLSRPQLYYHLRTRSEVIALYLSMR